LCSSEDDDAATTWGITFMDPDRLPGAQILGIVLVDGLSFDHAVSRCVLLGCHPGGHPRGTPLPGQPESVKNRLMNPGEALKALTGTSLLH
jgi:hypothetical protein